MPDRLPPTAAPLADRSARATGEVRWLAVPRDFHFLATVRSHGWYALAPFVWGDATEVLERPLRLDGRFTRIAFSQPGGRGGPLRAQVVGGAGLRTGLSTRQAECLRAAATRMFGLDVDVRDFLRLCRRTGGGFDRAVRSGFGRMLRAPTLYEDVVKILATTNTTWAGTKSMVAHLVNLAGRRGAFPTPDAVASLGAKRLRTQARWGYRAAYLAKLSRDVAAGRLDLDAWIDPARDHEELARAIRAVSGLGPYACAHVQLLLGRHHAIGVDTVFRAFVRAKYFPRSRKMPNDRRLLSVYANWGDWRALAYWADLWDGDASE